jgi:hypothetical protein
MVGYEGHWTPSPPREGVSRVPGCNPIVFSPLLALSPLSQQPLCPCPASPEQHLIDPLIPLLVPAQFKSLPPFPRVMEQLHQDQHFLSDLDSSVDYRPSGLLPDNLNLSPHHTTFDSFDL